MSGNQSLTQHCSLHNEENDHDNDHEKTYVTINADSFNEKDFDNFLNCLDTLRESENERKKSKKVIKNYCVQVPYIDNSLVIHDEDSPGDDFDRTCDEMKNNISQMFSYFEEDVHLNYDDYDKLNEKVPSPRKESIAKIVKKPKQNLSESFREKFIRNRRKIKEMGEAGEAVDTKPIIRGAVKKWNAPITPNNSLNKNQVDKIMNEFNRVKINYYSKENYVEFTDIDYFYCDTSDIESIRSDRVGKLKRNVMSKFEEKEEDDDDRKSRDIEVVPKNSVRDKINMFTKMDVLIQPCDEILQKTFSAPSSLKMLQNKQKKEPSIQMKSIMKNTSAANKNQNKCFIKDINNSLLHQAEIDEDPAVEKQDEAPLSQENRCTMSLLYKIASYAHLNDIDLLMTLERIVNQFDQSLLHTIDALMSDDAFTLVGNRMRHLNVETRPSIEQFNEMFVGEKIDMIMENFDLQRIEADMIQLQFHVKVVNRSKWTKDSVYINVIFMAQYETDSCMVPPVGCALPENTFFVYFKTLFKVLKGIGRVYRRSCLINSVNHRLMNNSN